MTVQELIEDLSVRVAKAEIERDAALARVEELGRALAAWTSQDKEKLLDTLHIIGIPARDLADIYRLEVEWRKHGGSDRLLADLLEREALKDRVRELESERGDVSGEVECDHHWIDEPQVVCAHCGEFQ